MRSSDTVGNYLGACCLSSRVVGVTPTSKIIEDCLYIVDVYFAQEVSSWAFLFTYGINMDLKDGDKIEVKGSGAKPYILQNIGGVYSCSCPAWRNQSATIDRRTCKHLKKVRGEDIEAQRLGVTSTAITAPIKPTKEPVIAPALLLAESWDGIMDPTGWWMSEKLDGVRAMWDGEKFISRLGNKFFAPTWFTECLPKNIHLDGELWIGRKQFQKTVSVVRRQDAGEGWKNVKYLVFDMPKHTGTFEQRLKAINDLFIESINPAKQKHIFITPQTPCSSLSALKQYLDSIEQAGGEGIMLRQSSSKYEGHRSRTLLKVKSFKDEEAKVVGHYPGRGKHKGRLGGLEVELINGTKFRVGTGFSDAEREDPPKIGSTITFRYQELTDGGVPRFPAYVGPCVDKV